MAAFRRPLSYSILPLGYSSPDGDAPIPRLSGYAESVERAANDKQATRFARS